VSWQAKSVSRAKPLVFALGLFPLARWIWLGMNDGLTANPTEFLSRSSGTWTLVCLLVTLAITPVRQLLGQPALLRLRRMCGLFTFFYATLHAVAWAWWDQGFDPVAMGSDILKRPFITVGMAGFILLVLLAGTSTQGWIRRLGKRWQTLHRAVYLIGILAILHYFWHKAGKNDFSTVILYGAVLAALLAWRVQRWLWPARPARVGGVRGTG
jgi:sulfoxide reductase heme-binding subunit YedZ